MGVPAIHSNIYSLEFARESSNLGVCLSVLLKNSSRLLHQNEIQQTLRELGQRQVKGTNALGEGDCISGVTSSLRLHLYEHDVSN